MRRSVHAGIATPRSSSNAIHKKVHQHLLFYFESQASAARVYTWFWKNVAGSLYSPLGLYDVMRHRPRKELRQIVPLPSSLTRSAPSRVTAMPTAGPDGSVVDHETGQEFLVIAGHNSALIPDDASQRVGS
jgi:hypothetical protein